MFMSFLSVIFKEEGSVLVELKYRNLFLVTKEIYILPVFECYLLIFPSPVQGYKKKVEKIQFTSKPLLV